MNVLERLDSFRDEDFHLGPMVPLKQQLELDKVSVLVCVKAAAPFPMFHPKFSSQSAFDECSTVSLRIFYLILFLFSRVPSCPSQVHTRVPNVAYPTLFTIPLG